VNYHQLPQATFDDRAAFMTAYFKAPLGVLEFTLV
jgi:hypothetical protein